MSIASRITEIEQHIGNAYDKIEDLGIDLTDVDKNIDNISSMLENVWGEYPKVPASDVEEASLNGTKKGRINIDLKGNTEQDTLTGKNLLDLSNLTSQTINGVTFTPYYENGLLKYINVNGTATANTIYNLATSYTMPAGSYILNGCPSGGSWGTYSMAYGDKNDSGNGNSFNLNDSYSKQAYIRIGNGTTVNNIKFYPMIRLSSVTDSSYEPYCGGIPSPNPDYPQQIKNVTGQANVKIQNKNLLNISSDNYIIGLNNYDNFILEDEMLKTTGNVLVGFKVKTKPNQQYTAQCFGNKAGSNSMRIREYSEEPINWNDNFIKQSTVGIKNNEITSLTITTSENTNYILYVIYADVADLIVKDMQLEQGTTATDFVPHQEQNYSFSLKSKNLVDISTLEKGYVSATGIITVNDTMGERYSKFIKVKPDTNYIFSIIETSSTYDNWFGVGEYSSNNYSSFIRRDTRSVASQGYIQFTTSSTTEYIVVSARNLKDATKIQLEQGTTATDYEPYYDIKAMEGTTLQDDGIHNKWCEVSLTNQFWGKYTNTDNLGNTFGFFMNLKKIPKRDITATNFAKCNILMQKQRTKVSTSDEEGFYLGDGTDALFIKIRQSLIPNGTIEELQTLLSNTNAKIQFELAEEEIIPYNETQQAQYNAIKQAKSYDEQTNISQTYDELPFILDIEALKGKTNNEVNLLNSNNKKTAEYLETSLEPEEVEKIEEVEEPKEVEIQEEERVDTEENTENTAENAENSAESEEK